MDFTNPKAIAESLFPSVRQKISDNRVAQKQAGVAAQQAAMDSYEVAQRDWNQMRANVTNRFHNAIRADDSLSDSIATAIARAKDLGVHSAEFEVEAVLLALRAGQKPDLKKVAQLRAEQHQLLHEELPALIERQPAIQKEMLDARAEYDEFPRKHPQPQRPYFAE